MADYAAARRAMIETQIRPAAVTEPRLLQAFDAVPRESFVPEGRRGLAYTDGHQPLSVPGRFLASPVVFARMAQLAEIAESDQVIIVGAGSGYSVAVFAELAAHVVGVERDPQLRAEAEAALSALSVSNYSLHAQVPAQASGKQADVIFVEGALTEVPVELLALLGEGGRLVALLAEGVTGVVWVYSKRGGEIVRRSYFNAKLPTVLSEPGPTEFVF